MHDKYKVLGGSVNYPTYPKQKQGFEKVERTKIVWSHVLTAFFIGFTAGMGAMVGLLFYIF